MLQTRRIGKGLIRAFLDTFFAVIIPDSQCDLLSSLCGQVEDEHAEEGNEHRGKDQIDRVEQGLAPDGDVERDVRLSGFRAGKKIIEG